MISARTRPPLAAAKRRGVKLGGDRRVKITAKGRKLGNQTNERAADQRAADVAPVIKELRASGAASTAGHCSGPQSSRHSEQRAARPPSALMDCVVERFGSLAPFSELLAVRDCGPRYA